MNTTNEVDELQSRINGRGRTFTKSALVGGICFALSIACLSPAFAQTWQSLGKTAVSVATANTACDSSKDTVAISADRNLLLTCKAGIWTKIDGGGYCALNTTNIYTSTGKYDGNSYGGPALPIGAVVTQISGSSTINDISSNTGPSYPSPSSGGIVNVFSPMMGQWGNCPNSCVAKVVRQCTVNGLTLVSNQIWSATYANGFVTLVTHYP